jgi:hypothetical protein
MYYQLTNGLSFHFLELKFITKLKSYSGTKVVFVCTMLASETFYKSLNSLVLHFE